MQEDLEEVQAPIYAWRAYRIEQVTRDYESQWVLTPLYYRNVAAGGNPGMFPIHKPSEIYVDPLSWNNANQVPELDETDMMGKMPGFHVFHGYGQAVQYASRARDSSRHIDDIVIAKVELGGVVVEHELGYRAEMTRIVSLEHPNADEEKRAKLAAALGWPFEISYCDLLDTPPVRKVTDHDISVMVDAIINLIHSFGYSTAQVVQSMAVLLEDAKKRQIEDLMATYAKIDADSVSIAGDYTGFSIMPDTQAFDQKLRRELELQIRRNWSSSIISQKPFDLGTGV